MNGCRIAFRQAKYVPRADKDLSSSLAALSVSKSGGSRGKTKFDSYSPSSSSLTSPTPAAAHHTDLTSYSPSPVLGKQGGVQVKVESKLESAPLPPASSSQPQPPPPSQEAPSSPVLFPVTFTDGSVSSGPDKSHRVHTTDHTPYPPPMQPAQVPVFQRATPTTVPSSATAYSAVPLPYQMNPGPSQVPTMQPNPFGYMGGAAFDRGPQSGGGYYPSAAPPSNTNYDNSIGFSFGGGGAGRGGGGGFNSNLPAPYNPYRQQQPQPGHPNSSGYRHPAPQGGQGGQGASGGPSYGFNF